MKRMVSMRAALTAVVCFIMLSTASGFAIGHLRGSQDTVRHCQFMPLQKATALTHQPISEAVNKNHCVFVDNGGRVWLTITWYDDPEGWSFEDGIPAGGCKTVEALQLKQACWIPKDHGIMLRKSGKLIFVLAATAYNDEDLVDMASAVAKNL